MYDFDVLGRDLETGVCGNAAPVSKEKGERGMNMLVDSVVEAVTRATEE